MTLKIIGAGFGRTGTKSTKEALNQLGFHCYHMDEVFKNGRIAVPLWIQAAKDPSSTGWERIFDGYDATVDWPAASFWKTLIDYYPDAKVILNVRDAEKWYESMYNTLYTLSQSFLARMVFMCVPGMRHGIEMSNKIIWTGTFKDRFADKSYAIEIFNKHNDEVKRVVSKDRLLLFDVKQGWGPLCTFLNLPVPDTPFPKVNDTKSMEKGLKIAMTTIYGLFAFLVAITAAVVYHYFN